MYADMHLHTIFSDGTDSPLELCGRAAENGLKVISITDHDSVGAYASLSESRVPPDVGIIPGVEISTTSDRKMIHILGYFIDIKHKRLVSLMKRMSEEKTESTRLNFQRAASLGVFSYEWERVLERNPGQPRIGGAQVVKAMGEDGYEVPGMGLWDLFRRYFMSTNEGYISAETTTGGEAIDTIKSCGGVPVVAHPGDIKDDGVVWGLIRAGARGLEVYHPCHSREDEKRYLSMAESQSLFVTGGSDWHGGNSARAFAARGLETGDYEILRQGKFWTPEAAL